MKWNRLVNFVVPRTILQALLFCVVCGIGMMLNAWVVATHSILKIEESSYRLELSSGFPKPFIHARFKDYFDGLNYYFSPARSALIYLDQGVDVQVDYGSLAVDLATVVVLALVIAKALDGLIHLVVGRKRLGK